MEMDLVNYFIFRQIKFLLPRVVFANISILSQISTYIPTYIDLKSMTSSSATITELGIFFCQKKINMQNFEKGHFFIQESKNFFLFFMGDESPNAHESKSMIGLVLSAQQLTLQSSKVQNWQH